MAWWVMLLVYAATVVASGLLMKAPKVKASSLGDMQTPTAEEGRSLPVIWGTCCLKSPNVVWYGNYWVKAIKKSMGVMAFGRKYTSGYKYFLGMDLALCHGPVDALVDVMAGVGEDLKHVNYSFIQTEPDGHKTYYVSDPDCFGGDDKEGGLIGSIYFYLGSQTQNGEPYMSDRLGVAYPAYRGVAHAVLHKWYMGTSPYIKNLAFVLRRCPSNLGLTSGQTNIDGDANPAEIICECLKMKAWGLGFPTQRFDLDSFRAAGVTLASEGFGMSFMLDSPEQADKVIETVLQHIDGVCYTDPGTGLWTLKLIRPDYDPESIPEFNEDDIAECEFSRGSWEDTLNEVKVTYTDRSKWKQGMVQAQEPANFAIRNGELATTTIDFPGFSNAAAAQKVCNREMRANSYPVGKGRVKINRKAWALRMGSPFKLAWPALGIDGMCVRVTAIDYGNLTDGMIEAEICEDIFTAAYTAYSAPAGSGWSDPIGPPAAPLAQLAQEAPYQTIGNADRRVLCGAVRGDGGSEYYEVWSNDGGGFYKTNTVEMFLPSGLLASAYARNTAATDAVGFVVTGVDLEDLMSTDAAGLARGDNLLAIVEAGGAVEWCGWQSIVDNGDGSYTISPVVRGIFDTLPIDHAAGARVYFISDGGAFNTGLTRDTAYSSDQIVNVKLLPHNPQGTVAIGNVTQVQVQLASRAQKPYPPGKVQIAGQYWPNGAHLGAADATLTWAHRNRTAQSGCAIVAQDAGSVGGGPEGSCTVEVLINGAVISGRTTAGITGNSFTYTLVQRTADDADLNKPVQFRITPVNGALTGKQRTTDSFIMQP